MYKIYADDTLIYDSTLEDYKIGKGSVTLETNKSGSFTFSVYPDHFYYNSFVRLKTVITVYKANKILFRGRILNDVTDYWNNKVITCEGELGFFQDSIIRPFSFSGTPEALLTKIVEEHNAQVDDFKKFNIGVVTVKSTAIARENTEYESSLSNLTNLIEDSIGGYFFITHGEDGTEKIPTLNYLAEFTTVASQVIEFGSNLRDYTKTVKAEDIATAVIPLGTEVIEKTETDPDTGKTTTTTEETGEKLTIADINRGKDYVYNAEGVALYGWIFKIISWEDITDAATLKAKAEEYLLSVINQSVTIELNAIDLHLLDHSIESFNVGDRIRVISKPHGFDSTLLCNKQTLDLLKPENDSVILGDTYMTLAKANSKAIAEAANKISVSGISGKLNLLNSVANTTSQNSAEIVKIIDRLDVLESGSNQPVLITADNISKYFGVTNESYYFVGSGATFTSNNNGVSGSTAKTTLIALYDMDISFIYSYSSEANYDKFTLVVGDTTVESDVSGATTSKKYSGAITVGTSITFTYTKDSSNNSNDDVCTFSNMVITGEFTGG